MVAGYRCLAIEDNHVCFSGPKHGGGLEEQRHQEQSYLPVGVPSMLAGCRSIADKDKHVCL